MTEQTKQYLWPDLQPVIRQYVVVDDRGRFGIAYTDNVYDQDVLFAHPINIKAETSIDNEIYMTDTAWHKQTDGVYEGTWYDYDGPTFPANVPSEMVHRLTIVQDLGYLMPDKWAEIALKGSDSMGHWDYGATLGKVGGEPPIKGQEPGEMNVKRAEDYAREVGEYVTARAIRHAADKGYIPGARKIGRDWLIPFEGFDHYLDNRPKPGRK